MIERCDSRRGYNLISHTTMALQEYVADFAVFGDDYHTPDGSTIRDCSRARRAG
ncbi:hypothetical protein [Bradyrhizobium sp.]|uniref:hypothetical protein n=1 Tax=Bradyrhizobium sp. TaxID=376 RepID=UPI00344001E0